MAGRYLGRTFVHHRAPSPDLPQPPELRQPRVVLLPLRAALLERAADGLEVAEGAAIGYRREDAGLGQAVERREHLLERLRHLRCRRASLPLVLALRRRVVVDGFRDLAPGIEGLGRAVVDRELQLAAALPLLFPLPVVAAGLVVDHADVALARRGVDPV